MGFGAKHATRKERSTGELLSHVEAEDLVKYGFIPEFIGRVPVIGSLNDLEEQDLVRILTEPRNALIKQYERFFEMEGVQLEFTPDALQAVAAIAIKKGTGARALRSILENLMLDVMYDLPSLPEVVRCIVDRAAIEGGSHPRLMTDSGETLDIALGLVRKTA